MQDYRRPIISRIWQSGQAGRRAGWVRGKARKGIGDEDSAKSGRRTPRQPAYGISGLCVVRSQTLGAGRILYAYRNHDRTGSDWHYTYFRISVSYSGDRGKTFKYLSTVEDHVPSNVNGLCGRPGQLHEALYRRRVHLVSMGCRIGWRPEFTRRRGRRRAYRQQRKLDASSYELPIHPNPHFLPPATARKYQPSRSAVFENTESGPFSVDYVLSHDDGLSWGARGRLYTARGGKLAGAPQVYNVGGTLVASFMTDEDEGADGTSGYDGTQMKVVASVDGGRTWSAAYWPGVFNRDPTHFLALYSKDRLGAVSQLYELQN
ncbi:hypothetical protein F4818DRAFT_438740 [Hypoxylon cercidicola]|nr:hypothetical protein F4818DRAFT_438740 [Hypoxylon cercidicola]